MLVTTAQDFRVQQFPLLEDRPVTAERFLLIRPDRFDVRGCDDNAFADLGSGKDQELLTQQHTQVVDLLQRLGKQVQVFPGMNAHDTFCNNVFGTDRNRRLIVGNMFNPVRKAEADRPDVIRWFLDRGYEVVKVSDFADEAAELTGVLVIDHLRNIGFCGLSNRCTLKGAEVLQQVFGLSAVYVFPITIYHTNVGLSILAGRVCVICPEMFVNPEDAQAILDFYPQHIVLSKQQMDEFAGNVLAVSGEDVVVSSRGFQAWTGEQKKRLSEFGFLLHQVELSELEKSGGSMRCLLAEVF
ncbi:MAG: arginine deiminase-related protein [Candidatus Altimarinota bacterium]